MPRPLLLLLVLAFGALTAWIAADLSTAQVQAPPATTAAAAPPTEPPSTMDPAPPATAAPPAAHQRSVALGLPFRRGRLVHGVLMPTYGDDHMTYDATTRLVPSPEWRRWGTDVLVELVLRVLHEHRQAHPEAPLLLVGDLSRPKGGIFDQRFGGLGHASHQNGLDIDIYYPRRDRIAAQADTPSEVDRVLSQDLVDRFVAAGARYVFVGKRVGLRGPKGIVSKIAHHDDHLHVRIPNTTR